MGVITRAIRNISRRKTRALLVIIALGFAMAIMISIPAGVLANQAQVEALTDTLTNTINQSDTTVNMALTQIECTISSGFEGYGFSNNVTGSAPPSGNAYFGQFGGGDFGGGQTSPMNESLYSDISSIDGVASVVPILKVSEGSNVTMEWNGRTFTRQITEYVIEGVPLNVSETYTIISSNITAGRNLQEGDTGVVVLSENNSAYFNAGVGDHVTILGQEFLVIGIHGSSGVSDATTLYMNLTDAQTLTNKAGYITSLEVFAESSDDVNSVATAISNLHQELTVTTYQDRLNQLAQLQESYATALANAQASIAQTQTTAIEEIVVVIVATSLIVLFVMLYTVRERTKEIGTLKAIGFSNRTIMSQFMLEGILLSIIAGVVGIAIGYFAAPYLASLLQLTSISSSLGLHSFGGTTSLSTTVSISPTLILAAFGLAVALGAIGSLYPAWRAAKVSPVEAMRYE